MIWLCTLDGDKRTSMKVQFWDPELNKFSVAEASFENSDKLYEGWLIVNNLEIISNSSVFQKKLPLIHRGYFDSHLHACWLGEMAGKVDLVACPSLVSLKQKVLEFAKNRGSKLVEGFGWDQSVWEVNEIEISQYVDRELNIEQPLLLHRVCGHAAIINRSLKNLLGLSAESNFIKDEELKIVSQKLPKPSVERTKEFFLDSQEKFLKQGINAISEMSATPEILEALSDLSDEGQLLIDVQTNFIIGEGAGFEREPLQKFSNQISPYLGEGANLELSHAKHYLDGSFGARTAWLKTSYCDESQTGLQMHSNESLIRDAKKYLANGFALCFHAIGDAALEQALWLGEELYDEMQSGFTNLARRHRLEHVQLASDEQLKIISKQGFWSVNLQPHHRVADKHFIEKRLGRNRWQADSYRLKSFLDNEIALSVGSDAPIDSFLPDDVLSSCLDHHNPQEALAMERAIQLYTFEGRQTLGFRNRKICTGETIYCQHFDY